MQERDPAAPLGSYCPRCLSTNVTPGEDETICCKECGQRFVVQRDDGPPAIDLRDASPEPMNRKARRRASVLARRAARRAR